MSFPEARDIETFLANGHRLHDEREAAQSRQAEVQNAHTETEIEFRQLKREHDEISAEVVSLRERRSNIDSRVLAIRDRLCTELSINAEDLPFAGELLQVRDNEADWEGAAERLLHSFGLSLLVSDAHYVRVAVWVDRTHLRGRLMYFRVRDVQNVGLPSLHPQSLVRKLIIKPDSPFYPWLRSRTRAAVRPRLL